MPLQHLINHVALVVDKSGSMRGHSQKVVEVFDRELNALKQRSVDAHQETRISIYLFDDKIEVLTFDMDVMRFTSLKDYYKIGGQTALIDATLSAILDHQKLPELYGDHAFLLYVITDGQENASRINTRDSISNTLKTLADNWTTGILVPDQNGVRYAQQFGFNAGSIATWDTSASFENVGQNFNSVMTNYMDMRSKGIRSTKTLFTLDSSTLNQAGRELNELPVQDYDVFPVHQKVAIKPYVESWTGDKYRLGSAYYEPADKVVIQDHKSLLVQNKKNGKVYWGHRIRDLLGLPYDTVKVDPGVHKDWRIFVQSTSVNRNLLPNTYVLVMK
jgi:hypothetical protein